jgi:ABC-type Zn uptake system ZnuABC Zn-binding protein ZnuA
MTAHEKNPKLKADFEKQAAAYRKLAEKIAEEYGLKMPPVKNA